MVTCGIIHMLHQFVIFIIKLVKMNVGTQFINVKNYGWNNIICV